MKIKIVCIGKIKESYLREACFEYVKRLSNYCKLEILELKEERLSENAGEAEEKQVKLKEGEAILSKISKNEYVVSLEVNGKLISSPELAKKIDELGIQGKSEITFVIGGSLGLSEEVSNRSDFALSFSKLTFTHQMIRPLLLEQIYRAFKINKKEVYHK